MRRRFLLVGSWDLLHYGHLLTIRLARKMANQVGGELFVAVNTDSLHKTYKKRPTVFPYKHRSELIKSMRDVDRVVPTKVFSPLLVIKKYGITDYLIPEEWVFTKDKEISYLTKIGGKTHIIPRIKAQSSTDIRNKIVKLFGGNKK